MKKLYIFLFSILAVFYLSNIDVNSQSYFDVDPGVGTLNTAIAGDTIEGGARADSNRIYRLKRGDNALYLTEGSVSNSGYHLTIVAEDGDGAMPFIQPKVGDAGSSRPFRPRGDFTIKGLHVTNIDDLGGMNTRIIRCSAEDIRIEVDDCWLEGDGQSCFRLDDGGMSLFIRNTVINNIGDPADPNNGRGIDDRGNNVDTVVFDNCTFYNITSRIIRDGGGWIKHAEFTNNTVVNTAQFGISFGEVGTLLVKDNLFMNAGFLPDSYTERYIIGLDSIGAELEGMGITQSVDISYNSFWRDTSEVASFLNDSITLVPLFNGTAQAFVTAGGMETTLIADMVEFADGVPFNDSIVYFQLTPGVDAGDAPFWVIPDIPGDGLYHRMLPYDFNYVGGAAVNGSSTQGYLGSMMWTGTWPVSTRDLSENGSGLSAYPTPVEDNLTIGFTLNREASVAITVYNIVGKQVATIRESRFPAGTHEITWNGEMLETGMYILRMNTGAGISTTKILKK